MAASDVLVALARSHFSFVIAELQAQLKAPGEISKEFVLITVGKLISTYGTVQHPHPPALGQSVIAGKGILPLSTRSVLSWGAPWLQRLFPHCQCQLEALTVATLHSLRSPAVHPLHAHDAVGPAHRGGPVREQPDPACRLWW